MHPPIPDCQAWAERHFADTRLGDPRRTRRLVQSAQRIAQHPQKSFTQTFDWNQLRGWYRVCDQPTCSLDAIQQPHRQLTRESMLRHDVVLILHDTTELDFTSHRQLQGTGPIGDGNGRGFLQHNSLAVLPDSRQVLGLAFQQIRVRQPAPENETQTQRKKRPRESQIWQHGFDGLGPAPAQNCWVNVCDRGADDYETMSQSAQLGQDFLIRASTNRTVFTDEDRSDQAGLLDHARGLCSMGTDQVDIPSHGGKNPRAARTAKVELAAAAVWIPAPDRTPNRRSRAVIPAWVIRVWEADPPRGVAEPLEWILICSVPTESDEEVRCRRDWYSCRWGVEVFHDIEKNGCGEEDRRFENRERMEACLGVLSVVAVRVYQLKNAVESQPEAPASEAATEVEIELISRWEGKSTDELTVKGFVFGVAKLGGFLARRGDGQPGVQSLWRGYQRLQDLILGAQLRDLPHHT
jgi:hypothetical protein